MKNLEKDKTEHHQTTTNSDRAQPDHQEADLHQDQDQGQTQDGLDEADQQQAGTRHITYGPLEQVEVTNWEEIFANHQKETEEMNKEREAQIERKEKKEKI